MNELEKLQSRQAEIHDRQTQILADAEKAGGKLSTEQEAEYDALDTEFAANCSQIASIEKTAARKAQLAARPKITPRRTSANPVAGEPKVVKEGYEDDPKRGFKDHREFLVAVMDAGARGYTEDPRLKFMAAGADEHSTVSDPYGGFLLPVGFSPDIMKVMAEADPIGQLTTKVPMENATVNINARVDKDHSDSVSGGFRVYRTVETQASPSSRQEYEQVVLSANMLTGLAYATEQLLERSPVSFAAIIEAGMRDEFPSKLFDERLNGTGTGMFEGVINAACTVSVAKETNQGADTILYENIIKMRARCWGYGSAVWLANHDCLPQIMLLSQAVGTGGVPVWQPSGREDHPDILLGRPIYFTEYCKTVGDEGDLVLGNWSQYLEGTLSPMRSAESMHVRFENHERTFKFWMENDGRPWWKSALTPKNSSNTLSPFVTLATR